MKLIVIIGITGNQGASVADVFLQEPGWRIRGVTRNTAKESSRRLEEKGIEMVAADLDDPSSLIVAFRDAHAVFGVTDFWQPIFTPEGPVNLSTGQSLGQHCFELELQRGKNIADAANKISTLERFIYSATSNPKKWSKGKCQSVYHFGSKAAVVEYVQEKLPALAKKTSIVQIGLYATNWKFVPFTAPRKQPDGTYLVTLSADGNTPLPMIHTRKDTGYLVRALIMAPPGKNLLGFGSLMSWNDYMKLWGKILGVGARYKQISVNDAAKLVPGDPKTNMGLEVAEGFAYMGEFGYDGGDPSVIHPKDLGVDMTSIEDYIRSENWSSIL
ncbi:hypothetical protein H0H87_012679 [Tephrocybe sp. NHM501043]|nr:hypothetical protein H0H87_012679 [Tephrocybe sp. NHM501043]